MPPADLIDSLNVTASRAVADVSRCEIPEELCWLHGLDLARELAKKAGRFPVPFLWWTDYTGGEKPRAWFFAVLGSDEEALETIRTRLAGLPDRPIPEPEATQEGD